ncbi:MAG TPA: cytochrome c biogenesis protein CcdA [Acidimicrobiales bacterium]|nr:cytochrome c biogenesis protein CcdA [Acidimicrobiales bacterium]
MIPVTPVLAAGDPGLIVAFGAGMLSFLSPCVLPLVPGYLSLMSGVSTSVVVGGGDVATATDTRRLLRATLLFVAGFTVVFVALGSAASLVGGFLLEHQRAFNRIAGSITLGMGLLIASGTSPALLQRERRLHVSPARLGSWAAPVMGMAFAFGWTPCIGPVLAGVLSVAASEGSVGKGALLLAAYSLGLGVPFVAAGVGFARLAGVFGWFKRHARVVNLVSGLMLAAFGLVLLLDRVSWLSAHLVQFMTRIGLERLTRI